MTLLPGVYQATKKDGTIYYRSSITFHSKHISLGSAATQTQAHNIYLDAQKLLSSNDMILPDDYRQKDYPFLPFSKWICLLNFKNNGFYIKTPIYLHSNFFSYYLSPKDVLFFDADDLFYFSKHSIMRRGNHLFVAEYGMQTNIHSRYGIKNFARLGIDYIFVNGDSHDFRYSNIKILNAYHGVTLSDDGKSQKYITKIHIHGDFIVGKYSSAITAAIAYNKAVDTLHKNGFSKNFEKNYIEELSSEEYLLRYQNIVISRKILNYPNNADN